MTQDINVLLIYISIFNFYATLIHYISVQPRSVIKRVVYEPSIGRK